MNDFLFSVIREMKKFNIEYHKKSLDEPGYKNIDDFYSAFKCFKEECDKIISQDTIMTMDGINHSEEAEKEKCSKTLRQDNTSSKDLMGPTETIKEDMVDLMLYRYHFERSFHFDYLYDALTIYKNIVSNIQSTALDYGALRQTLLNGIYMPNVFSRSHFLKSAVKVINESPIHDISAKFAENTNVMMTQVKTISSLKNYENWLEICNTLISHWTNITFPIYEKVFFSVLCGYFAQLESCELNSEKNIDDSLEKLYAYAKEHIDFLQSDYNFLDTAYQRKEQTKDYHSEKNDMSYLIREEAFQMLFKKYHCDKAYANSLIYNPGETIGTNRQTKEFVKLAAKKIFNVDDKRLFQNIFFSKEYFQCQHNDYEKKLSNLITFSLREKYSFEITDF